MSLPTAEAGTTWAKAISQTLSNHKSSPENYQFTLHDRLALGSTSTTNHDVDIAHALAIGEDREVSTFDFAQSNDVARSSDESNLQWRPEVHRRESAHLSYGTIGRSTPDPSLSSHELRRPPNPGITNTSKPSSANVEEAVQSFELLKFYRYTIAPWLDICDADQRFGVELLTKSSQVRSLRSCVKRVAAASSGMLWLTDNLNPDDSNLLEPANDDLGLDANMEAIVGVLNTLTHILPDLAAYWAKRDDGDGLQYIMERLLLELEYSTLHACAYWLSVRLGIVHHRRTPSSCTLN